MKAPLEERYFEWLCGEVNQELRRDQFSILLRKLHSYAFVWLISGDDNRADDCIDLRLEFLRRKYIARNDDFLSGTGYSVLEVLVAFSRRACFETDITEVYWVWLMIDNLGLGEFDNDSYPGDDVVDAILERFIWRNYDRNGNGGLFPLRRSRRDQRKVEIWYQFCEYLVENNYI